jgi:hypothetical protein
MQLGSSIQITPGAFVDAPSAPEKLCKERSTPSKWGADCAQVSHTYRSNCTASRRNGGCRKPFVPRLHALHCFHK